MLVYGRDCGSAVQVQMPELEKHYDWLAVEGVSKKPG